MPKRKKQNRYYKIDPPKGSYPVPGGGHAVDSPGSSDGSGLDATFVYREYVDMRRLANALIEVHVRGAEMQKMS